MHFDLSRITGFIVSCVVVLCGGSVGHGQTHSAFAEDGGDPTGTAFYTGASHPPGPGAINIVGSTPGYLNAVSGGAAAGADGELLIGGVPYQQTAVIGLAIHTTDAAGPSHSLSALSDPALTDIINDLNASTAGGPFPLTAYDFGSPPAQFSSAVAALSSGEASYGGQRFDILLTGQGPGEFGFYLSVGFSNEIGNLDGITALNVTDIGATPEPGAFLICAGALGAIALLRRRRVDCNTLSMRKRGPVRRIEF